MLVLNRKPGEALQLGGGIRIVVLSCDRGGARIGIEAPRSVPVLREELVQQVAAANHSALAADAGAFAASVAPLPRKAPADAPPTEAPSAPAPRARSGRSGAGG